MSTLRTNTLSNVAGTASTAIENAINGSAKAWVNFNGTGTVAIRAQYNVSSITDNGTGDYTVNFTTAMTDANYCSQGFSWASGKNASPVILGARASTTYPQTTTTVRVTVHDNFSESVLFDADVVNVAIFR
jgi:hypothetical protein